MCHLTTLFGGSSIFQYLHNELMHTHPSLMLFVWHNCHGSFPGSSLTFLEILALLNPCILLEGDIRTVGTCLVFLQIMEDLLLFGYFVLSFILLKRQCSV